MPGGGASSGCTRPRAAARSPTTSCARTCSRGCTRRRGGGCTWPPQSGSSRSTPSGPSTSPTTSTRPANWPVHSPTHCGRRRRPARGTRSTSPPPTTGLPNAPPGTTWRSSARVAEGLGDVLMLQGDYPGALHQFEQRSRSATTGCGGRCSTGSWATSRSSRATRSRAARSLEGALRALGRWVPRSTRQPPRRRPLREPRPVPAHPGPAVLRGPPAHRGRRARVRRHPPLQPAGARLLVQRREGPVRCGPICAR